MDDKEPRRVERSIALSRMAFLLLLKFRAHDIPKQDPWGAFPLKRNFTWQLAQTPLEHSVNQRLRKGLQLQAHKAA
jgi:hypothetical protein